MQIPKNKSIKFKIAKSSYLWEYPLKNKKLNVAFSIINGRLPDSGRLVNTECTEIYYVISGSGTVFIENKKYKIRAGSGLLIEPKQRYYVVGKKLTILCPTAPAWYPEQHKTVE